jgi:hypothetical protein
MFATLGSTWSVIALILGGLAAIWGLYKTAEGVRDLYFETFPTIAVAGTNPNEPFGLPFAVTNPSGWFPVRDLNWEVLIVEVTDTRNNHIANNTMRSMATTTIEPRQTKYYNFPIQGLSATQTRSAVIDVTIRYSVLSFKREPVKTRFTWMGNTWIKGEFAR